jgi:drug/metabolite transporter (DMT)-like permease
VWLLGDRLAAGKMTGLALAVAGVLVVNVTGASVAGGRNVWLGSALVFAAVCCEAAYTLLGKKLTANLSPLAIAVWASVGAGLLFAPFALIQLRTFDVAATQWRDWLTVVFWGAGTMGLGSVLWFSGLRRLTGVTASGFMAVMPVSALLLSYLLLGEAFSWWHLIGMGVVLAGLAFVVAADRKQQER